MSIEAEVAYETMKINKYIESLKKNRKARKDDKQMKYEFHVGDYVETVGGFVGWVSRVRDDGYIWVTNKDVAPCSYRIPEAFKYFNRIGQYNFTKKDEGKIEPLVKSWILEDTDNKGEYHFDSREVIKKINELVEAVNRLEEKVNEMAQN